ncbi:Hypothetical predicted protein, partial [Olea europaea subsp. europaea]
MSRRTTRVCGLGGGGGRGGHSIDARAGACINSIQFVCHVRNLSFCCCPHTHALPRRRLKVAQHNNQFWWLPRRGSVRGTRSIDQSARFDYRPPGRLFLRRLADPPPSSPAACPLTHMFAYMHPGGVMIAPVDGSCRCPHCSRVAPCGHYQFVARHTAVACQNVYTYRRDPLLPRFMAVGAAAESQGEIVRELVARTSKRVGPSSVV